MTQHVLILGGYGNFGKRIAIALTKAGVSVIIAGRDAAKADALIAQLPAGLAQAAVFDLKVELATQLEALRPAVVIHTAGPFQNSDYSVAEICIAAGVHYIDLADARDFVAGFSALDSIAKSRDVVAISGASTVPALSSAVLEHFLPEFTRIDSMEYGISPGQKAERGLATTRGVLSYVGKRLKPFPAWEGKKRVYGWQDVHRVHYPEIGVRWMANCDIPDLDLFPARYDIKAMRFSAGLELPILHLGLWLMSWPARLGLPLNLQNDAQSLLDASNHFNRFGTDKGGMHVIIRGGDRNGKPIARRWYVIARRGHGPEIPTVPAILLAKRLLRGDAPAVGAQACVGLITLKDYMAELEDFAIEQI